MLRPLPDTVRLGFFFCEQQKPGRVLWSREGMDWKVVSCLVDSVEWLKAQGCSGE